MKEIGPYLKTNKGRKVLMIRGYVKLGHHESLENTFMPCPFMSGSCSEDCDMLIIEPASSDAEDGFDVTQKCTGQLICSLELEE